MMPPTAPRSWARLNAPPNGWQYHQSVTTRLQRGLKPKTTLLDRRSPGAGDAVTFSRCPAVSVMG